MNAPQVNEQDIPLCVDCDGTLIRTDLLHEGTVLLLKQAPLLVLCLPFWLLRGKAYMKARIAENVVFNWSTLPYCVEVIQLIQSAKQAGRKVVLATASPTKWALGIAEHLGLFDDVLASDENINLEGQKKSDRLTQLFGASGYDYAGNSRSDLPVWASARKAMVVTASKKLALAAGKVSEVSLVIDTPKANFKAYLKTIRLHQWIKNILIFVPLVAAHQLTSSTGILAALLAFVAFGLCASSVYILNDLLDLEADRIHIRKRHRPFASAVVPIWHGVLILPVLLAASTFICSFLPFEYEVVLIIYYSLTIGYSFRLKRQVIVDVMLLAALYTIRVVGGAAATAILPSFWLLAFSMFVFLSLAMVKRYSELLVTQKQDNSTAAGRGYFTSDLQVLLSLGSSAGMASVMVLALYINDPDTAHLYPARMWLWLIPVAMLYWVTRIWSKTCRGEVDDDPVVFAVKDRQSVVIAISMAACFALASSPITV